MKDTEANTIRGLLAGMEVADSIGGLTGPFRRIAEHLAGVDAEERSKAWGGFICSVPDPDRVNLMLASWIPRGVPPRPPRAASRPSRTSAS